MAAIAATNQRAPAPTVTSRAESCAESFHQCLEQAATIHSRELSLVEDQLARFSLWCSNIRVFALARGSLDHRLREAPDVQDAIAGVLEALGYRVQGCLLILQSLGPKKATTSSSTLDRRLDEALRGIASEISLLHRFSNTIRRASKETQNQKAAREFAIKDDEGNDVEPFLHALFMNHIRDRFPGASDVIRQRLASTMVQRRKRILYRRTRYGKTKDPIRPQEVPSPLSKPRPEARSTIDQPEVGSKHVLAMRPAQSNTRSIALTATTLTPDSFQRVSGPSVASASKSVALSDHEDLRFPPAPCGSIRRRYNKMKRKRRKALWNKLDLLPTRAPEGSPSATQAGYEENLAGDWDKCLQATPEVICPFCFCALPVRDVVDDKKWKLHVMKDLDPYVCMFEECDSPDELYSHSNQWLKHMRGHSLRWRCTIKSHGEFVCRTKDEYVAHMKTAHAGKFTDAQLGVLANRNGRTAGPMFESCPLCGADEANGNIEEHLVGHLRFLALKSLPSYEEAMENPDEVDGEESSATTSSQKTRSTIKNARAEASRAIDSHEEPPSYKYLRSTKYDMCGGFRNYMDMLPFPQGLQTRFEPPPVSAPQTEDTSADFVDDRLFDEVPSGEWRIFEWGHIPNAQGLPLEKGDPVVLAFRRKMKRRVIRMDPDCAICHTPYTGECDCEARDLERAVMQAEHRVMAPQYNELRTWVRRHAQTSVLNRYKASLEQRNNFSGVSEPGKMEEAGEKAETEHRALSQQDVNTAWSNAVQQYPETLGYFFGLAEFSLPAEDDPGVQVPPLSTLQGLSRKDRRRNVVVQPYRGRKPGDLV
ncbi:hypothetical protein F4802DRAFT_180093 [Xylaria palmicola]|nr:hypothetical protein F4802DRAFT_180093 [Xylaria palmicola]